MNVVFDFCVVLFTWQPARFLPDFFPIRAATPALASALDAAANVDAARSFGWQAVQFVSSVKLKEHLVEVL